MPPDGAADEVRSLMARSMPNGKGWSNVARIGFDARLYGYRHGGIQTYLSLLAEALVPVLAARGHTLTVYHAPGATLPLPAHPALHLATLMTPPHHQAGTDDATRGNEPHPP